MQTSDVLVLYNSPQLPKDHPAALSENTIIDVAELMAKILNESGFRARLMGLGPDPATLWRELTERRPDVVVNLFEGNLDDPETESYVAGLLEWSGVPFTGSPGQTLSLARAKHTTKTLLKGAGIATADFFVVEATPTPVSPIPFPVIVKPAKQDASVGMSQASVCMTQKQLDDRVAYLLDVFGPPVIVEQYIPGRELNVALLELPELQALPPAEVLFNVEKPGEYWAILTYDAKWNEGTPDYNTAPPKYPADIPEGLADTLMELAKRVYRLMGCRDYARIDFRVSADSKPYVLEVNPNPEISDEAGFAGCLGSADVPYREFIVRLVKQALSRGSAKRRNLA
jgi:D-alanine-D-alanine ligase